MVIDVAFSLKDFGDLFPKKIQIETNQMGAERGEMQ